MNKNELLTMWHEAGKDVKKRTFFHREFKKWLDTQPDQEDPVEGQNEAEKGTVTRQQEKAYHLWLDQVAQELDREGHTLQDVVQKIAHAEVRPTGKNLKEVVWRAYMQAAVDKVSGRQLTKSEVDRLYEGLNKWFGQHFHIHVPFPTDEGKQLENLGGYKSDTDKGDDYPEYTGAPTF